MTSFVGGCAHLVTTPRSVLARQLFSESLSSSCQKQRSKSNNLVLRTKRSHNSFTQATDSDYDRETEIKSGEEYCAKKKRRLFRGIRDFSPVLSSIKLDGITPLECAVCLTMGEAGASFVSLCKGTESQEESCSHRFCFNCIHEWAKATNVCPLCKQRFRAIRKATISADKLSLIFDSTCSEDIIPVLKRDMKPEDFSTSSQERRDTSAVRYEDITCEVCSSGYNEEHLLLCDICDRGYHMECLQPIMLTVPPGNWYCHDCSIMITESRSSHQAIDDNSSLPHSSDSQLNQASTIILFEDENDVSRGSPLEKQFSSETESLSSLKKQPVCNSEVIFQDAHDLENAWSYNPREIENNFNRVLSLQIDQRLNQNRSKKSN